MASPLPVEPTLSASDASAREAGSSPDAGATDIGPVLYTRQGAPGPASVCLRGAARVRRPAGLSGRGAPGAIMRGVSPGEARRAVARAGPGQPSVCATISESARRPMKPLVVLGGP